MTPGMNLPPLTWLRAFEAAARHLSFTRAAAELHLTQSAVSQHVRNLEASLGRSLFFRKTRTLALTEADANYLPVVQEAFALIANGTNHLSGADRGQRLFLSCNLAFSTFWLAPRLGSLMAAHPWLSMNIATSTWGSEASEADASLIIRFGRKAMMPDSALRLRKEYAYPVCAPTLKVHREHLAGYPLFDCAGMLSNWETWLESTGRSLPSLPSSKAVNIATTFVVSMTAAERGGGLSMSHDSLAEDALAQGRLIRPFPEQVEMTEAYFLIDPGDSRATPATRAFSDWLRGQFQTRPGGTHN